MSQSQPSLCSALSTIATRESCDSLVIGNSNKPNHPEAEIEVEVDYVVTETGESDVSTMLKFVVASQSFSKNHDITCVAILCTL